MRSGTVRQELDRAVAAAARSVAGALAVASASLAAVGAVAPGHRLHVVHVGASVAAAVSFLAIAALLRRRPVPPGPGPRGRGRPRGHLPRGRHARPRG